MKALLFCIIFFFTCTHFIFAQTDEGLDQYNRDIGFNTNFIINGILNSEGTPFDILYKQQINALQAYRFGASVYFSSIIQDIDYTGNNTPSGDKQKNFRVNLKLSVGKEWQKLISQKWVWYYGGDIAPSFSAYSLETETNNQTSIFEGTTVTVAFQPFLGLRFNINDQLYLQTESHLSLSVGYTTSSNKSFDQNGNENSGRETSGFIGDLSARPASSIFLFYRFNK